MIPEHLQGKSGAKVLSEAKKRITQRHIDFDVDIIVIQHIAFMETMLLLAIRDALMNVDGKVLCDGDYALMGSEAEGRAIAFLDMVLPKE